MQRTFFLVGVFLIPFAAVAASVSVGGDYFLKGSEKTVDDMYVLADSAVFAGLVAGDAVAAGSLLRTEGEIAGDALFGGERLLLGGKVNDDARLFGAEVVVSGTVADDAVLFGAEVVMLPSATVGGNLYIVGSSAKIRGTVAGSARVFARALTLAGTVAGDMEVWADDIAVAKNALIGGNFIYHAPREVILPSGVRVGGEIIFRETERTPFSFSRVSFGSGFLSLYLLMMLSLGFALFFLARARAEEALLDLSANFWQRVLRGALVCLALLAVVIVSLMSVVGLPLAVLSLALFVALVSLSCALAGLLIGAWLENAFFKRSSFPLSYRPVLLGTLLFGLLALVPFLGFAAQLLIFSAGAGSVATVFYRHLHSPR